MVLKESAKLAVQQVLYVRKKAGIPTAHKRVLKTHMEWQALKKTVKYRTVTQMKKEEVFSEPLEQIFHSPECISSDQNP